MQLTNKAQGFYVKGSADDQYHTLGQYRVLLAPLRFGAGIKGKIADAWWVSTPVVSTSIGAESMRGEAGVFGGRVEDSVQTFVKAASDLYTNEHAWNTARQAGNEIVMQKYNRDVNAGRFVASLLSSYNRLAHDRSQDFTSGLLWHGCSKGVEYMSKYLELKSKNKSTCM